MRRGILAFCLVALVSLGFVAAGNAALTAFGPVDPVSGLPRFYQDLPLPNGVRVGLCTNNAFCTIDPLGLDRNYWAASVDFPLNAAGVSGRVSWALVSSYESPAPAPGFAIVFTDFLVRIDGLPVSGNYVVTHPFGTKIFTPADLIPDNKVPVTFSIDFRETLPATPVARNFSGALNGHISAFLRAVAPAPPAGFVGNVNVLQTVTGSPTGTNLVQITGPAAANLGGPARQNVLAQRRFALEGRRLPFSGVTANSVTYSRLAAGNGSVNVVATSARRQNITAAIPNLPPVRLTESATVPGRYTGRVAFARGRVFNPVRIRNLTDVPSTIIGANAVDLVTISGATFTAANRTLRVTVRSSDAIATGGPTLQVFDQANVRIPGTFAAGVFTSTSRATAPARVTVRSSAGGRATRNVTAQ